jgi:Protein of unknown function (DUF2971)
MREVQDGLWKHLAQEPPELLYHYTSLASFVGIVKSKSLYATDILYLNDLLEYRHARQMIARRIEERLSEPAELCDKTALRWYLKLLADSVTEPVYVASFSEKADDISQWRGYVPAGKGICLGFDSVALREAAHSIQSPVTPAKRFGALGKVIYVSDDEGPSFNDFITSACQYLDIINGDVVRAVAGEGLINHGTPFYKHASFKDEAEWRVVLWSRPGYESPLEVEFRMGASTLVPFAHLRLASVAAHFLKKVIVGPTPNMDLSASAAEGFLRSSGLESVSVHTSQVPYRSW